MANNLDYIQFIRKFIDNKLLFLPGVRALIIDERNKILLQLRTDFNLWGLPSGSPKIYETIIDCLVREVQEETGLICTDLDCIGYSSSPKLEIITYPNGDQIRCFSLLFLVRRWSGKLVVNNDETKRIEFFDIDKLPKMIPNHFKSIEMYKNYAQYEKFQVE